MASSQRAQDPERAQLQPAPQRAPQRSDVPLLTAEQLQQARAAATAARRHRADVKARLRRGELTFAEVLTLAARDDVVAHIKVFDVLRSLPRVGEAKARDLMQRHDVAPTRRLRGLGKHQAAGLRTEFASARTPR